MDRETREVLEDLFITGAAVALGSAVLIFAVVLILVVTS